MKSFVFNLISVIAVAVLSYSLPAEAAFETAPEITLTSSAFQEGQKIPVPFTCDGEGKSPALRWTSGPDTTESYAIIMQDPDAPGGTWTHWILFNLPPRVYMLPEGLPAVKSLANSERQGSNDFKKLGYGGPCPPSGSHRYIFKVVALNTWLHLDAGVDKKAFLDALEGHILAEGTLMGTYARKETVS